MKVLAAFAFLASLMLSDVNAFDISYFVPGTNTTDQPGAVLRWTGSTEVVEVCSNDGSGVTCTSGTFLKGDETWTKPIRYIKHGPECDGNTVRGAPSLTAAPTDKQENVMYMYTRTNNNKIAGFQWNGVPSTPSCLTNNIWDDFPAFASPGSFYVDDGDNSFVLVVGIDDQGHAWSARDSRTHGRTQAVKLYDEHNYALWVISSPTFARDTSDTIVMYFSSNYNQLINPLSRVYEFKNGPNGVWKYPLNWLSTTVAGETRPSYEYSLRVAKNVDDTSHFMLWTRENKCIGTDYAKSLTAKVWMLCDEDCSERPGSSCSELVSFHHHGWNERWTLCFYKGYNSNQIWWLGYTKPL